MVDRPPKWHRLVRAGHVKERNKFGSPLVVTDFPEDINVRLVGQHEHLCFPNHDTNGTTPDRSPTIEDSTGSPEEARWRQRERTPPGSSEYAMYRGEMADPPALICQVGSTTLKYHRQAIDDLHEMLEAHGDWVPLGAGDE